MKTHGTNKARSAWTDRETRGVISLYFSMAALDSRGLLGASKSKGQTSKAALVRAWLQHNAPTRSKGSVEAKLMNVSASLEALGAPGRVVRGFKPLRNRSASLDEMVLDALEAVYESEAGAA